MKTSKIAILAAMGIVALVGSAAAQDTTPEKFLAAGCIPGSFNEACWIAKGNEVAEGDDDTFDSVTYVSHPGIAVTGSAPVPLTTDHDGDESTPEVPLLVDHDGLPETPPVQAYAPQGPFAGANARVHGYQSVAVGSNSRVGKFVYDENGDQVFLTPENYDCPGPQSSEGFCRDFEGNKIPMTTEVKNGTAIGANSHVSHDNSTAIGAGAKSTDANQVTLGTKDETIRAEGITSQKSKDRQDGPLEVVTSDSGGRLATDGGEIFSRLGSLEGGVSDNAAAINAHSAMLSDHASQLGKIHGTLDEHAKGIAIATAMPDAWLSDKERFAIAGGVGGFGDETALGFIAIGRIDETWSLNAGLGADTEFKEFGWKAGVRAGW